MTFECPYQVCRYAGEGDLEAIAHLINTCHAADQLEHRTTATRLREDFADPMFEVEQDLRLWRDVHGELMAAAELWRLTPEQEFVSILVFEIHPEARSSGLAEAVLGWAESRIQMVGQTLSVPSVLHSGCRESVEERRSLLTRLGFRPERSFLRLKRSLETPIAKSPLPPAWQIRSVTAQDAEQWVEMFNETFVDHWNHHPATVREFQYEINCSDYDSNLDLVVVTPEGQMAAFCRSEINPERNARLGVQEGHVGLLGTRRGYRRLGLARTLLTENLLRLQLLGMTTATIGVDAQNPSGAVKLYESVGFELDHRFQVFRKDILHA